MQISCFGPMQLRFAARSAGWPELDVTSLNVRSTVVRATMASIGVANGKKLQRRWAVVQQQILAAACASIYQPPFPAGRRKGPGGFRIGALTESSEVEREHRRGRDGTGAETRLRCEQGEQS